MNCQQNIDPLKLVREGTSQPQRALSALDPAFAPVNERTPAHLMVFARAYAAYLKFYDNTNNPNGDWQRFFANDVSVLLANAAIQNVGYYSTRMQEIFAFLNNLDNDTDLVGLRNNLGHLFATIGSLAKALDELKNTLPHEIALKNTLSNLIATQLAPAFRRLIAYQKFGADPINNLLTDVPPTPVLQVLGTPVGTFAASIGGTGLSKDWITDGSPDWATFVAAIAQDGAVYGTGATLFEKNNHIATHNLFTAIFDQFLKTYARTVSDAKVELEKTLTEWDKHDPSYTLFLAFVRLNEFARQETNTLTARHLDFYYREILQLKEKPATPGQAHLLLELAKHIDQHLVETGEDFKASKDDKGIEAFFGSNRDLVANKAKVVELKTVYRHVNRPGDVLAGMNHRLFASPVANSSDGLGAPIDTEPQSWHPLFNKSYFNGALQSINMPRADVGFAVASHYLFLAEGTRKITLDFEVADLNLAVNVDLDAFFTAFLTTKDGWLEKSLVHLKKTSATNLQVELVLSGNDPAIIPYNTKTHGYQFGAELPVLRLMMRQNLPFYLYLFFQSARITSVAITVDVKGLKTLSVTNDFGSVDTSKPFLPFGAIPIPGNKFVIGNKEIFQKLCIDAKLNIGWQQLGQKFTVPNIYSTGPAVKVSYLQNGLWGGTENDAVFGSANAQITLNNVNNGVVDKPNYTDPEEFTAGAANGFFRISLDSDMGHVAYQTALRNYLIDQSNGGSNPVTDPGAGPTASIAQSLSLDYVAKQTIVLSSANTGLFQVRKARFHHIGPFGDAERHAYLAPLSGNVVALLPQFDFMRDGIQKESISEFYIGISDLVPPQNLALLFQVLDGTADPLAQKPEKHIHWSYMVNNEWKEFATEQVEDLTGALMRSGVVTLTFPREATNANTILPTGKYWVRLAVSEKAEATCQLLLVAAQALLTTFEDKGNDPAFPAKIVPAGTIAKLAVPDAAIKKVQQPFDSFNGRGAEAAPDFYRRVSERLRHKDRAIALWDYEHLILEAFPYVYRAKCLNHTEYEPTETGLGIYRELAPGHVTIVTLPDQSQQNVRNPLRPYTSLGTLLDIEAFLKKRTSCFVKLHVKNPQFEEIKTEFKVRFFPGFDETFYLKKLQEDITRFLSPWAFPGGGLPSFGGKVYASVLLNFIEERPWVDYVADFKLRHKPSNSSSFSQALTEAEASTAVSVLVSVPADQHTILLITTAEAEAAAEKCPCEA